MGPFGGWDMPIQYPDGIMKSHLFTRAKAGLFDVSHMLGVVVRGADRVAFMESLCTADIQAHSPRISCHATTPAHPRRGCCASHPARAPPSPDAVPPQALPDGSGTLSLLTNEAGGIIDDMIITNAARGPSEKRKRVGPHAKSGRAVVGPNRLQTTPWRRRASPPRWPPGRATTCTWSSTRGTRTRTCRTWRRSSPSSSPRAAAPRARRRGPQLCRRRLPRLGCRQGRVCRDATQQRHPGAAGPRGGGGAAGAHAGRPLPDAFHERAADGGGGRAVLRGPLRVRDGDAHAEPHTRTHCTPPAAGGGAADSSCSLSRHGHCLSALRGRVTAAGAARGVRSPRPSGSASLRRYTGEDGFEIAVPPGGGSQHAVRGLWSTLLEREDVTPVGLGARDSLRLEAGLCLYGERHASSARAAAAGGAERAGTRTAV